MGRKSVEPEAAAAHRRCGPPYAGAMAQEFTAVHFRQKVRNGDVASVKLMLKAGVDYKECGLTQRKWTPLHTACWGTAKPPLASSWQRRSSRRGAKSLAIRQR